MPSNREHKLPSGAVLKITTATFERALELFKAYCEEMKGINLDENMSTLTLEKNTFCAIATSPRIEKALAACMDSVTYQGLKVTAETYKDPETWGDYMDVCAEVAKDNLNPFMKNLSARFPVAAEVLRRFLA